MPFVISLDITYKGIGTFFPFSTNHFVVEEYRVAADLSLRKVHSFLFSKLRSIGTATLICNIIASIDVLLLLLGAT